MIYHDLVIGDFFHINTGAILNANCKLYGYSKIDACEFYSVKKSNQEYNFEAEV